MNIADFLTSDELSSLLNNINTLTSIICALPLFVAAFFGVGFLADLREKRNEAAFSYLARLQSLLSFMLIILEKNRASIWEYLKIDANYEELDVQRDTELRKELVEYAKQIIQLLNEAENQYPPEGNWSKYLKSLHRLLFVCQYMDTIREVYWKSSERGRTRKVEYEKWISDTQQMLSLIEKKQSHVEKQMTPFMSRMVNWVCDTLVLRLCMALLVKLKRYIKRTKPCRWFLSKRDAIDNWTRKILESES